MKAIINKRPKVHFSLASILICVLVLTVSVPDLAAQAQRGVRSRTAVQAPQRPNSSVSGTAAPKTTTKKTTTKQTTVVKKKTSAAPSDSNMLSIDLRPSVLFFGNDMNYGWLIGLHGIYSPAIKPTSVVLISPYYGILGEVYTNGIPFIMPGKNNLEVTGYGGFLIGGMDFQFVDASRRRFPVGISLELDLGADYLTAKSLTTNSTVNAIGLNGAIWAGPSFYLDPIVLQLLGGYQFRWFMPNGDLSKTTLTDPLRSVSVALTISYVIGQRQQGSTAPATAAKKPTTTAKKPTTTTKKPAGPPSP